MLRFDPELLTGIVMLAAVSGCSTTGVQEPTLGLAPTGSTQVETVARDGQQVAVNYDDNVASAGRYLWKCDNGDQLRVDNVVTSITIGMQDGDVMQLPASPPDSRTRYVFEQYAFVIDGGEALFFRPKAAPLNCKRGQASTAPIVQQASIDLSAKPHQPGG